MIGVKFNRFIKFTVFGHLRGKGRPRFISKPYPRAYTSRDDLEYEKQIREAYLAAGGEMLDGPVMISLYMQRPLPKSASKSLLYEEDVHKPDIDNCIKSVMDALNGAAYMDDAQVISVMAYKLPRVRLESGFMLVFVFWNDASKEGATE